jgi:hypothetical protein
VDLDAAMNDALKALTETTAERDRLNDLIADLTMEVDGLRKAIERHSGRELLDPRAEHWREMARTEAILAVLRKAEAEGEEHGLSPAQITKRLLRHGRDDQYNPVSAALAHLKDTGRAHTVGRGQWKAGPDPDAFEKANAFLLGSDEDRF